MKYAHFLAIIICTLGLLLPSELIAMEGQSQDEPRQEENIESLEDLSPADLGKKLLNALEKKNKEEALRILKLNPDITMTNQQGFQSIHLAASNGWTDIVAMLFQRGASVNAPTDNEGAFRPIFLAVREGHLDTLAFLLANGADVTAQAYVFGQSKAQLLNVMGHVVHFACIRTLSTRPYQGADEILPGMKKMLKLLFKYGASFDEPNFNFSLLSILQVAKKIVSIYNPLKTINMYNFLSSCLENIQPFSNFRADFNRVLSGFHGTVTTANLFPNNHHKFILLSCFLSHGLLAITSDSVGSDFNIEVLDYVDHRSIPEPSDIALWWTDSFELSKIKVRKAIPPNSPWLLDKMNCKLLLELAASRGTTDIMEEIVKNSTAPVTQEMFAAALICAAGSGRAENVRWLLGNASVSDNRQLWLAALAEGLYLAVLREQVPEVKLILDFALEHDIELDVRELGRMLHGREIQEERAGEQRNENYRLMRRSLSDYFRRRLNISHLILRGAPNETEALAVETTSVGAVPHPAYIAQLPAEIRVQIHELARLGRGLHSL